MVLRCQPNTTTYIWLHLVIPSNTMPSTNQLALTILFIVILIMSVPFLPSIDMSASVQASTSEDECEDNEDNDICEEDSGDDKSNSKDDDKSNSKDDDKSNSKDDDKSNSKDDDKSNSKDDDKSNSKDGTTTDGWNNH